MSPEFDRSTTTQPIRRLRVVPNPTAARAARESVLAEPVRTGGRHRKPDPDDEVGVPTTFPDTATAEVVPAQRAAGLTVPPPGRTSLSPGA